MEKVGIVSLKTSFNPNKTNQKYNSKQSFGNSITSIEKQAEKCPSFFKGFLFFCTNPIKAIKTANATSAKIAELKIEAAVLAEKIKLIRENRELERKIISKKIQLTFNQIF